MTFVTTGLAIAGAACIAIPILIHLLFRRRRKPVEWAAMRFLIEAFRRHRRRLHLEQIILLTVRCLIVALLGAALARPLLAQAGLLGGGTRTIFLVVDDGLASAVRTEGAGDSSGQAPTALAQHVRQAVELVRNLRQGDAVALITASRPARAAVVPPSTDQSAIIKLLEAMKPSQSPTDLPAALALLRTALADVPGDRGRAIAYLFSEFRAGSARLDAPLPESALETGDRLTLLASPAAATSVDNVQVTAIEPVRSFIVGAAAEGATQVTVRLARSSAELGRTITRVRLSGEGLPPIEARPVAWEPGQSRSEVDFMVDFTAGRVDSPPGESSGLGTRPATLTAADRAVALSATIDDDAMAPDNHRFAIVQLRGAMQVVLVDRRSFGAETTVERLAPGSWLARALTPAQDSPVNLVTVDPAALDKADLRVADAAVLPRPDLLSDAGWKALHEFLTAGGVALFMPPNEINVHQWTDRLAGELGLPWRIALEPTVSEDGIGLAAAQPASELLRLISNDLPELQRPIVVHRWLAVDEAQTTADRVLMLANGSPLLIAGSPDMRGSATAATERGADVSRSSESTRALTPSPAHPVTPSSAQTAESPSTSAGLAAYLAVAADLGWTNLPSQPLMVPLVHEVVRQGVSVVRSARQVLVGDRPVVGQSSAAAQLQSTDGASVPLNVDGRPVRSIHASGLYAVLDPAGQRVGALAVNIDPAGARTEPQAQAAVSAWLSRWGRWELLSGDDPAAALGSVDSGLALAAKLLAVVLGLLVLETALARWFSHAAAAPAGPTLLGAVRASFSQPPTTAQGL